VSRIYIVAAIVVAAAAFLAVGSKAPQGAFYDGVLEQSHIWQQGNDPRKGIDPVGPGMYGPAPNTQVRS
jgi:hypothetical protein